MTQRRRRAARPQRASSESVAVAGSGTVGTAEGLATSSAVTSPCQVTTSCTGASIPILFCAKDISDTLIVVGSVYVSFNATVPIVTNSPSSMYERDTSRLSSLYCTTKGPLTSGIETVSPNSVNESFPPVTVMANKYHPNISFLPTEKSTLNDLLAPSPKVRE